MVDISTLWAGSGCMVMAKQVLPLVARAIKNDRYRTSWEMSVFPEWAPMQLWTGSTGRHLLLRKWAAFDKYEYPADRGKIAGAIADSAKEVP
jgi:hypothetical protein